MLKVMSVFSGIGAFEYALNHVYGEAGYELVGYSEFDKYPSSVFQFHHKSVNLGDILGIDISKVNDFDLLVGGPPCQPYSKAGKRLGADDPRGEPLVRKYIEILEIKRPKMFIFENVKGLTDKKFQDYLSVILGSFESLGYSLETKILDSCNFGLPQRRKRFFVVGNLVGQKGVFDFPEKELKKTFKDYLVPINQIDEKYIYSKTPMDFMLIPNYINFSFYIILWKTAHNFLSRFITLSPNPFPYFRGRGAIKCELSKFSRENFDNSFLRKIWKIFIEKIPFPP